MKQVLAPSQGTPFFLRQTTSGRGLRSLLLGVACLTLFAASQASATTTNFSGTFTTDSQVDTYSIVIGQTSNVTFQTDSYGGGTLGGSTVHGGGFVPILSLFGPGGAFITDDGGDAACSHGMTASAATGLCNDAYISSLLAPGTYTVAISEFDNFPGLTLNTPFSEAGNGNFTEGYCTGATTGFQEIDLAPCAQRTNAFAFTETTTAAASTVTPEPSSLALAVLPLFALAFVGRRFA